MPLLLNIQTGNCFLMSDSNNFSPLSEWLSKCQTVLYLTAVSTDTCPTTETNIQMEQYIQEEYRHIH